MPEISSIPELGALGMVLWVFWWVVTKEMPRQQAAQIAAVTKLADTFTSEISGERAAHAKATQELADKFTAELERERRVCEGSTAALNELRVVIERWRVQSGGHWDGVDRRQVSKAMRGAGSKTSG